MNITSIENIYNFINSNKALPDQEVSIMNSMFDQVDREDAEGNHLEKGDGYLNANEWKAFIDIVKPFKNIYKQLTGFINQTTENTKLFDITPSNTDQTGSIENTNSTIDIDMLFGDNESIDAKYLTDKYNMLGKNTPPELQEISRIINQDMYAYHTYDLNNLFNSLIIMINNQLGIENTNPPVLTKDAITTLGQGNIFEMVENILKSDEFKNMYYLNIDGQIDDFAQGTTGDCWLLSGLKALSASEEGRQYLRDAIKDNGDGTYTVTFKGYQVNRDEKIEAWSGIITYEDIVNAKHADVYSSGDLDALIFELALEKCRLERSEHPENFNSGEIITADTPASIIRALTGYAELNLGLSSEKVLEYEYDLISSDNTTSTCSFWEGITVTDIHGKEVILVPNHAYAIVNVHKDPSNPSQNTITINDPNDTGEPIVLSWEEFSKTNANVSCFCDKDSINVDDIFKPFINGDMDFITLRGTICSLFSQGVLSETQKEQILSTAESLGLDTRWLQKIIQMNS